MNIAVLTGHLTADVKTTTTQNGKTKASFTIASEYSANETTFMNCVCYDRVAEFAEKFFKRGSRAEIRGKIHTYSYKTQDGRDIYVTEIVVNELNFGESKAAAERRQQNEETRQQDSNGFENLPFDDYLDMPFK